MGVRLQSDEEDRRFDAIGTKDRFQLTVIGNGLANGFGPFINHVEGVIHRHVIAEPGISQHPAALQHGSEVVPHAHLANEFLGTGGDADLEVAHARLHHQLRQLGVEVVGADVGSPTDACEPLGFDGSQ